MTSISALWIGGPLPVTSQMCLSSFVRHGHDVILYTFDSQIPVPDGLTRVDAREILPEESVFANPDRPSYAGYANLFRYRLLQKQETTWVDADVLCLGPLPEGPYLYGYEWRRTVNNAVLRAPRDSELLRLLYDRAVTVPPEQVQWGQLGPALLTQTVGDLRLTGHTQRRRVLYPVHFIDLWRLWDPEQTRRVGRMMAGASTLHLFNEWLRRCSLPIRSMTPPEGSFMAQELEKAGLRIDGDPVDADWVRTVWRKELDVRGGPLPRIIYRRAKEEMSRVVGTRTG